MLDHSSIAPSPASRTLRACARPRTAWMRLAWAPSLALWSLLACAPTSAPTSGSSAVEAEHQHWERLDPAEQHKLEARFEELERLAPEQRQALEEKKRALDRRLEAKYAELSAPERAALADLPTPERKSVLRECLLAEKREQGLLKRPRLPQSFLDQLERAQPGQRRPMLEAFHQRVREEGGRAAIQHVGEKLGLSKDEIERRKGLPLAERLELLQSMRRQMIEREVEKQGLPPFLDAQAWQEMQALSDREFVREWNRRMPHPFGPRLPAEERRERGAALPERAGARGPLVPGARAPEPALGGALRPRIDELIELRRLPQAERREQLAERARERALRYLEEHGDLPADELAALRELHGEPFFAQLKRDLRERPGSPGELR